MTPTLAGPVYWRKNPLLASSMVPLLLTLADGRLSGYGPDDAVVLDGEATGVRGSLGRMGTFKLTVGGTKFALVGRGSVGGAERGHSDLQRARYEAFLARYAVTEQPGAAGPVDAVLNGSAAATMGMWRDALAAAGASMS